MKLKNQQTYIVSIYYVEEDKYSVNTKTFAEQKTAIAYGRHLRRDVYNDRSKTEIHVTRQTLRMVKIFR